MGSSRRPKPRGQPRRAAPPGRATGTGGLSRANQAEPDELVVSLVAVDAAVAATASVGDLVRAVDRGGAFEVRLHGRRLGDIPPRFTATVSAGYRSGSISRLSVEPLRVVVILRR